MPSGDQAVDQGPLAAAYTNQSVTAASASQPEPPRWPPIQRVGFRFAFSFFVLMSPMIIGEALGVLPQAFTDIGTALNVATWSLGVRIGGLFFHGPAPAFASTSGFLRCYTGIVVLTALMAGAWSAVDRRHLAYPRLHRALRLVLRYALAAVMIVYGLSKILALQFPPLSPGNLAAPVGTLSLSRIYWISMGAAPAYQLFAGLAEAVGAVLLLARRTTALGALILVGVLSNVVMINFTYNIGVQIPSVLYLTMAIALLAPDLGRLAKVLVLNHSVAAVPVIARSTRRDRRILLAVAKALVIALLVLPSAYQDYNSVKARTAERAAWGAIGGGYEVVDFRRGGKLVAPGSWRPRWDRVGFDPGDNLMVVYENRTREYPVENDSTARRFQWRGPAPHTGFSFSYQVAGPDRLLLKGVIITRASEDTVEMDLRRLGYASPD